MPAWIESELAAIHEMVTSFSEEALRRVIEQAKDPDKADQLLARLADELSAGSELGLAAVALCVVLGEAGVQSAIPLLLKPATAESQDALQEAAAYALQRMGGPAFTAAMDLIESSPEPAARVLAYEILHAAAGADPQTKARVQDFCLSRVDVETARAWPEDDWNPGTAVCHSLLVLEDWRVRPLLERCLRQVRGRLERRDWQEMLRLCDKREPPESETDWRTDWPQRCREWAELYEPPDFRLAENEADVEEIARHSGRLVAEFEHSPFAAEVDGFTPRHAAEEIAHWLDYSLDYAGLDARRLRLSTLRDVLYQWMPRKISAEREYFQRFPDLLTAFLRFLHAEGRLETPERFFALAEEARKKLPRLADDPANWGMAKSFFMSGKAAGFDVESDEGLQAWTETANQGLTAKPPPRLNRLDEDGQEWDRQDPTVRRRPRVGRNDACPCGSGRKYKKCCGR